MKITENLKRLSLHDSRFENEVRENNNIVITFDWAKLENLIEIGIYEGVILGKTTLRISGVINEKYKIYSYEEKGKYILVDIPKEIEKYWTEIATTDINDDPKSLILGGVCYKDDYEKSWSEWCFNYETCEVEFNSYITVTEWLNGKIPND